METTVSGVGHGAIRQQHLEETTPIDGHIQRLLSGLQAAGGEDLLRTGDAYTGTQLQAGRQFAVLAGLAAGLTTDLIEQILELGTVALEAGRGNVGQVVGNGRQVHVLSGQTRLADPKCWKHELSPRAPPALRY